MPEADHLTGGFIRGEVARTGGHSLESAGKVALEVALHAFLEEDAADTVQKARVAPKAHALRRETLHLRNRTRRVFDSAKAPFLTAELFELLVPLSGVTKKKI